MKKSNLIFKAAGVALALTAGGALAAVPSDWSRIPTTDITLFYPGVSPAEWIMKGTEHGGARALRRGETCAGCHSEELADMGSLLVSGRKIEPTPIAGKAASIDVKVQAANDGENLYLRFSWAQPAASGAVPADAENPVKLAYMLASSSTVELAEAGGCWGSCHGDARTMPGAADSKTKYVKDGSLAAGIYYDLNQWRSGENKAFDGYVAQERVMEGGQALVSANGQRSGDQWTVEFVRKLSGGEGDVSLESGSTYNFGFAIHDEGAVGRFHHVSLGYTLGIDTKADISAMKQ